MKEVFQICDACIIYMDQYNMYKYEVIQLQHATWSYIIIMITCLLHIYDTPVLVWGDFGVLSGTCISH